MGKHLKAYELPRYTITDLYDFRPEPSIIVPAGAVDFPDVSFYQGEIDWDKMAANTKAVILRIGQNTWVDTQFERNYTEGKKRGVKLGGYYFYDDRVSPSKQADTLKQACAGKSFELEIFADWENTYGGAYSGLPNVVSFMERIEYDQIKCKAVGMYTGYYWFIEHSNPVQHANQYAYLKVRPLWLAWYAAPSTVKVPAPWTDWTHWQYGTPAEGLLYGCKTIEIDKNKFNGDVTAFNQRYSGGTTTPPTGGTMKAKVLETGSVIDINIRAGAGSTYADIGDLFGGDIIEYTETTNVTSGSYQGTWYHIAKVYRVNGVIEIINGWCWGKNVQEIPDAPASNVTNIQFAASVDIAGNTTDLEVVYDYADGTQVVKHAADVPLQDGELP